MKKCRNCGQQKVNLLYADLETSNGEKITLCAKCIKFYVEHFEKKKTPK